MVAGTPGAPVGMLVACGMGGGGGGGGGLGKEGAKGGSGSEAGVIKSVLATLGALAQQAGTSFKPYVPEVMPLVIEAIQVRWRRHRAAVLWLYAHVAALLGGPCRRVWRALIARAHARIQERTKC